MVPGQLDGRGPPAGDQRAEAEGPQAGAAVQGEGRCHQVRGRGAGGPGAGCRPLLLLGPHEHRPEGWTLRTFCLSLTEPMVLASRMILVNCKSCFGPSKACTLKSVLCAKMETSLCAFLCF